MADQNDKIKELNDKLDRLLAMQNEVSNEIDSLRVEIIRFRIKQAKQEDTTLSEDAKAQTKESIPEDQITPEKVAISDEAIPTTVNPQITDAVSQTNTKVAAEDEQPKERTSIAQDSPEVPDKKRKFDIENIIGKNLVSILGILVLIIGVGIGAKYSIENNLISPLTRIIMGYVVGIVLFLVGMRLKKNYLNFSAILISGAMTIFYFITYFAFSFYELMGQEIAFALMVIFTIFTVIAALSLDRQIIAHLGLVGAMAVPFLLSDESGNILIMFSYVTVINFGIAVISLRKNWKPLFYSSFFLTWLIYLVWFVFDYTAESHFSFALYFLTTFFILFYVIFVAYKLLNLKKYNVGDIIILLLNAMLFFGLGYDILDDHEIGGQALGLFALGNAAVHFVAATIINRRKLADRNLFYLIIGLVLICLTLAIPIQLDGVWVTMMWAAEAVVLFYIGRGRNVPFYEYISYALILIASGSLTVDWDENYLSFQNLYRFANENMPESISVIFNATFLTSLVVIISLGIIYWMHRKKDWRDKASIKPGYIKFMDIGLPVLLALLIYFALRMELTNYFTYEYATSAIASNTESTSFYSQIFNVDIRHRSNIWLINYTMVFLLILSVMMYNKTTSKILNWGLIILNFVVIIAFLGGGLYELSELRENYLNENQIEYFVPSTSFIWLRYLSIALAAGLIFMTARSIKKSLTKYLLYAIAETALYIAILWIATSELIHWLDYTGKNEVYGLALSIFWGIFSVGIISVGIWKKKKHLRFLGFAIFGITLVKLFFYDLSHLSTISKTIVMVSLGILLLMTSFLYSKYKIEDENEL